MTDWNDEYKARVRTFVEQHGKPVEFTEKRYDWQDDDQVSVYGWTDYDALKHCKPKEGWRGGGCHWIVPEGATMYERTYSQFEGTFTDNNDEAGVNVKGCHCACGKYTDMTLRWVGSVTDMLHSILQLPNARLEITL